MWSALCLTVSGNDAGVIEAVAVKLGIQTSYVRFRCTPDNKQEYLKNLMTDKKKIVVFCSNSTNDTVVLAQADISVHMNSNNNMTQTAADIILMCLYLSRILMLLDLFKVVFHCIFFNFAWLFVYNLLTILLTAGAFVNAQISSQYAELDKIVSVLSVILIALQLRWFKQEYWGTLSCLILVHLWCLLFFCVCNYLQALYVQWFDVATLVSIEQFVLIWYTINLFVNSFL